ncbi:hypothetical protein GCM10008983_12850 [Lentibacillus halophilus]|uniref:SdpI/YhfL protein family protein n=1 Tax=Lentibacillus halophilus TaxID=295065 RepID=A0ABN0Z7K3_9BACI
MARNRIFSIIVGGIALVALLLLPAMVHIYYTPYYYAVASIIFLMVLYNVLRKDTDEIFYQKWRKQKSKGFWFYVAWKGLWSSFVIVVVVCFGQLFGNNYTPLAIWAALSTGELVGVLLLIMVFGFASAAGSWFDNNKRYERVIDERMKNE